MKRFALIALFLGRLAFAAPWTARDTVIEAAGASLHLIDWSQTLWIAHHPVLSESNPVLGQHPSSKALHLYFGGTLLAHVLVAALLPRPWREPWQGVWTGVEGSTLAHNLAI